MRASRDAMTPAHFPSAAMSLWLSGRARLAASFAGGAARCQRQYHGRGAVAAAMQNGPFDGEFRFTAHDGVSSSVAAEAQSHGRDYIGMSSP